MNPLVLIVHLFSKNLNIHKKEQVVAHKKLVPKKQIPFFMTVPEKRFMAHSKIIMHTGKVGHLQKVKSLCLGKERKCKIEI